MKTWVLLGLAFSDFAFAGSCCIGSGPRSFVQLKHLQTYDVGIATSYRDVYARFNVYGNRVQSEKNQTLTTAVGGSFRLTPRSELYAILPFVTKSKSYGGETKTRSDLGDITLGTKVLLYDPFFEEDWLPEVKVLASAKAPTGRRDSLISVDPGTGNGMWEASLGVQLTKDFGDFIFVLSPSYTRRFSHTIADPFGTESNLREGDRFELTESITVPVSQRLSLSMGSTQAVDFDGSVNGGVIPDSGGRYTTGFVGASYFVTRLWTVSAAFESVLPFEKLSVNQEGFRTVTFTTTYAIY